jgi:hypothetical protein
MNKKNLLNCVNYQHSDFNDGFISGEDETGEENLQGAAFKER